MRAMSLAAAFRRISGLTGISRILGFLRDVAFAAFLGAGPAADAFLVALKLPNMFRRLTAEGALANAFVPTFADLRSSDSHASAMRLAGEVQTTLMFALLALVVMAEWHMPAIIGVLAPGFVDTPLTTRNDFPMPFMVSAARAAHEIAHGVERGTFDIRFPTRMSWLIRLIAALPYHLKFAITKRMLR